MGYSLGQAAKACGRSKTTIHRAIASGRLSASRTDHGDYSIDPSELARVFQADRSGNAHLERHETGNGTDPVAVERDLYRELAEERLETIRDLRQRLDLEAAERRQLSERLTAILTDQRKSYRDNRFSDPPEPQDGTIPRSDTVSDLQPAEPGTVFGPKGFPPTEPKLETVSDPPGSHSELSNSTGSSANAGLMIPRPPWWRRWFR